VSFVVALSGSPRPGSNTDVLVEAALLGAREAGAETLHLPARELKPSTARPAARPDQGQGYCIYHDDMDRCTRRSSARPACWSPRPVYFSGVSAQLKRVIDRCNCVTPVLEALGTSRCSAGSGRARGAAGSSSCSARGDTPDRRG
jgi:multimeric flavodoxin WrbA